MSGPKAPSAIDPRLLERLWAAKAERRMRLARLTAPEKVRLLVEMQKTADAVDRARGGPGKLVWNLR